MQSSITFSGNVNIVSQYEADAEVVLYAGDNKQLLASIPDGSVKLVVTSPPYNVGKSYEKKVAIESYLETQRSVIKELHRVLADDGSICWQVGNYVEQGEVFPLDIYYYDIFKSLGMQLRNRIVWHFGHGLHAKKRFSGRYETLLWFSKSSNYTFNLDPVRVPSKYPGKRHFKGDRRGQPSGNPLGKNPSDIWEIMAQEWEEAIWDIPNCKANHPEKTAHPAQFPIELAERCVLAMTNERDSILDPYAGVGSSLIAALKNNRKALGSERQNDYVEIAKKRIKAFYSGTLSIRKIGTPVFVPTGKEKVAQVPMEWSKQDKL